MLLHGVFFCPRPLVSYIHFVLNSIRPLWMGGLFFSPDKMLCIIKVNGTFQQNVLKVFSQSDCPPVGLGTPS